MQSKRIKLDRSRLSWLVIFGLAMAGGGASISQAHAQSFVYEDRSAPIEARVQSIIQQMTLDEKISLLSGSTTGDMAGFSTPAIPRLGIPSIKMNDGALGVRFQKATAFPSGILMGASFDPDLDAQVAQAIAQETLAYGHNMLLGPTIGISRQPFGGRNFESFGEDPYLTSQMVTGYIHGMQGQGVIASTKHFALNDQEYHRMTINTIADERTMQEIHLPAFHAAVDAGTWSIMASYNLVNGLHSTENADLLTRILKKDWGFKGFVVSDWSATHSTVAAANAGLDLEMPTGIFFGSSLFAAVNEGQVSMDLINDKVSRILYAIFASGIYDQGGTNHVDPSVIGGPAHLALAQKAAAQGLVLLKNTGNSLPLVPGKIKAIAVIGAGANFARTGGGGSSEVTPTRVITPLAALRERLQGKVSVGYALGAPMNGDFEAIPRTQWMVDPDTQQPGVEAEYFDNMTLSGTPAVTRIDPNIDFDWNWGSPDPKLPPVHFSVRWTGYIKAPSTGLYYFNLRCDDGARLYVDDHLLIDAWHDQSATPYSHQMLLFGGSTYKVSVEYYQNTGDDVVGVGLTPESSDSNTDQAVYLAQHSDAAVVFAGLSDAYEGEGQDRGSFGLPDGQDALIEAVAKANPRTIVVINAGNPVAMPWVNDVQGIIYAWYGGQEAGYAIADALTGVVNPSGKLPVSFPKRWEDAAAYGAYPTDPGMTDQVTYKEGIYVGYRHFDTHGVEPLFPFGFGLSYTQFAYSNIRLQAQNLSAAAPSVDVSFDVTNTGSVAGAEVAQLYVSEPHPPIDRPMQELKGFSKVFLQPGEVRTVTLHLDAKSFAYYDVTSGGWVVPKDSYVIRVGSSSRDIRLTSPLVLR